MKIEQIRDSVRQGQYVISFTHTEKLRRRRIGLEAIEQAISTGAIIESYPEDPRGPSCLISGSTEGRRPLHVVCGNLASEQILIVTAYEPDPEEWEPDWKKRKKEIKP